MRYAALMVQRDYLMRIIEQFVQAIASIIAHIRADQFEEARQKIDAAYRSLGVAPSMVKSLDDGSLVVLLGKEKVDLLMKLFAAEAELLRKQGREKEAAALEARVRAAGV
jgi:hypothetical protein